MNTLQEEITINGWTFSLQQWIETVCPICLKHYQKVKKKKKGRLGRTFPTVHHITPQGLTKYLPTWAKGIPNTIRVCTTCHNDIERQIKNLNKQVIFSKYYYAQLNHYRELCKQLDVDDVIWLHFMYRSCLFENFRPQFYRENVTPGFPIEEMIQKKLTKSI